MRFMGTRAATLGVLFMGNAHGSPMLPRARVIALHHLLAIFLRLPRGFKLLADYTFDGNVTRDKKHLPNGQTSLTLPTAWQIHQELLVRLQTGQLDRCLLTDGAKASRS